MTSWTGNVPEAVILAALSNSERPEAVRYLQRGNGIRIAALQFTEEQFELLKGIIFNVELVENKAFELQNYNLIKYLAKHHQLKCNLTDNVNNLENGIATIYKEDADFNDMILRGFIPYPGLNSKYISIVEMYKQGLTDEEIAYTINLESTHTLEPENVYATLSANPFWSMVTIEYIKKEAQKANSFPILFFNLDLLYSSMRPKNDMTMFQTCNSNYYDKLPSINTIPVTRYAGGMSKGLFYGERPKDACGYFFYYEPESTAYLAYNRELRAFNKTDACRKLYYEMEDKDPDHEYTQILYDDVINMKDSDMLIEMHIEGDLPSDLMFTAQEFNDLIQQEDLEIEIVIRDNPITSSRKVYMGKTMGLYAGEDHLDHILCVSAGFLGYDIVILENMVGSHQVVTEVLDTREDSFSHLWFKR